MPSICIQLYVLGLLVLMGSRAEEYSVGGGSMSTNLTSTPTDTPSAANQTPSAAANQTPSAAAYQTPSAAANQTPSAAANQTPSAAANQTPSAAANQTPSAAANQTPSAAANQTPSAAAYQTAQTTSSGLTSLSQSQGWESTATTETITSSPVSGSDIAGYVILFLILLVVVCLVVILCILRKKSRRYSFDLQHPGYDHDTPLTCMEQPGTFEPNNDQEIWDSVKKGGDEDPHAMSPVANGSAMGAGETGSTGENEGEKQGHGNSDGDSFINFCASDVTLTPSIKRVDFSLDLDLSDRELLGSSPDL